MTTTTNNNKTTVCVIGCGPGGMFFCHAVETWMMRRGKIADEQIAVTCYERANAPGGVWRAKRSFGETKNNNTSRSNTEDDETEPVLPPPQAKKGPAPGVTEHNKNDGGPENTTNMYEALWTNGPKENIEFFDYTFDEHFKCALPVYMPREDLLDYMVARVTKHCPDFFEKYVQFNTSVQNVKYSDAAQKFIVTTHNWVTNTTTTKEYDKVIWAAGENGKPSMPARLVNVFSGFKGRVIHSSDTANFEKDVKNKRVLLIGGSYSAEDLALMAVKVGAEKVYISSRTEENVVTWTTTWPLNKVELLEELIPVNVTDDGRSIQFASTWWTFPNKWVTEKKIYKTISDIDTVIFCTGYRSNMDMLDDELKAPFLNSIEKKVGVPSDWKMKPNGMSEIIGDVTPGDVRWAESLVPYPDIYRGVLISNPNMMYIDNELQPAPLFATDISSWLFVKFITDPSSMPSQEEMRRENLEEACRHLDYVSLRYYMDSNYCAAWDKKVDENDETLWPIWYESLCEHDRILTRIMARTIEMAGYPVNLGTYDELNELGEKTLAYGMLSYYHREHTVPENADEPFWRTFRDYTDADKFKSFFTGTTAVPLAKNWLDIDPHDRTSLGYSIPVVRTLSDESRHPKDEEKKSEDHVLALGEVRG